MGFCIVKASRLLVQITVTEMKKEIYRYSVLAGINEEGKDRTNGKQTEKKEKWTLHFCKSSCFAHEIKSVTQEKNPCILSLSKPQTNKKKI